MTATQVPVAVHRAVRVAFSIAELERSMKLPVGQHVVRFYVDNDPQRVWIVVEGGDEFAPLSEHWPTGEAAETAETWIQPTGHVWPTPGHHQSGDRHLRKVAFYPGQLGAGLDLAENQRVIRAYVQDDPYVLWLVVQGGEELPSGFQYRQAGTVPAVHPEFFNDPPADEPPPEYADAAPQLIDKMIQARSARVFERGAQAVIGRLADGRTRQRDRRVPPTAG